MQREDISEILGKGLPGDLMGVVLEVEERYGLNTEQVREIGRKREEKKRAAMGEFEDGDIGS